MVTPLVRTTADLSRPPILYISVILIPVPGTAVVTVGVVGLLVIWTMVKERRLTLVTNVD